MRYCKSTSFQANHNKRIGDILIVEVVCDTAKVRVFKQITTYRRYFFFYFLLFAILQKYEFSSKSQRFIPKAFIYCRCLRYCKSTSFQANHNADESAVRARVVVCDTAKVRVFKQITTNLGMQPLNPRCLRYCKSTSFQANHNKSNPLSLFVKLFAILQKYEFSSKSQLQRQAN